MEQDVGELKIRQKSEIQSCTTFGAQMQNIK